MKQITLFCTCLLLGITSCSNPSVTTTNSDISIADSMLTNILEKYNVEKYHLLSETYPVNPENQVTYLAEGSDRE